MRRSRLYEISPEFLDEIPPLSELEHGKLYLSPRYKAAIHLCACGCGAKISTPLHPTGWRLSYDGEAVSLSPSVGNWAEKCQSHYVIRDGKVLWAERFSTSRIERIRDQRARELEDYYHSRRHPQPAPSPKKGFMHKLRNLLRR